MRHVLLKTSLFPVSHKQRLDREGTTSGPVVKAAGVNESSLTCDAPWRHHRFIRSVERCRWIYYSWRHVALVSCGIRSYGWIICCIMKLVYHRIIKGLMYFLNLALIFEVKITIFLQKWSWPIIKMECILLGLLSEGITPPYTSVLSDSVYLTELSL